MSPKKEKVEQFISSYGSFTVTKREHKYIITGYYDDLDPEPQRTELHETFDKLRRDIDWADKFPFSVENVSDVKSRYGQIKLEVRVETSEEC